jgi:hypothetical protein
VQDGRKGGKIQDWTKRLDKFHKNLNLQTALFRIPETSYPNLLARR